MLLHTLPDRADRRMSEGGFLCLNFATSISGSHRMVCCKIGHPRAEKVLQHRFRPIFS